MAVDLHTSPRFSLNKLAEYLVATPRRRRRLILDQIRPVAYKTVRYDRARVAIRRFICDPTRPVQTLKIVATRLRDRASEPGVDDFEAQCLRCSARAIEAFVPIAEDFRYDEAIAVPGVRRDSAITIASVRVSVAPEIAIIAPGTERQIGAVKFHFSSSYPLGQEARRYGAAIMRSYIDSIQGDPASALCEVVDIFAAAYDGAPRAIQRRLEDVEAACEEIAERWPGLLNSIVHAEGRTS